MRYIGCSNFDAWRIADAAWHSEHYGLARFVSAQPEYSMVVRDIEEEILPACEQFGLGILPYFPLAHGLLTGKYKRGQDVPEGTRLALTPAAQDRRLTDTNFDVLDRLQAFVNARGKSLLSLRSHGCWVTRQLARLLPGPATLSRSSRTRPRLDGNLHRKR